MTVSKLSRSMVAAGLLTMGTSSPAFAEEGTVQAIAPGQGSGEVFAVAPEKLMLLGEYTRRTMRRP